MKAHSISKGNHPQKTWNAKENVPPIENDPKLSASRAQKRRDSPQALLSICECIFSFHPLDQKDSAPYQRNHNPVPTRLHHHPPTIGILRSPRSRRSIGQCAIKHNRARAIDIRHINQALIQVRITHITNETIQERRIAIIIAAAL